MNLFPIFLSALVASCQGFIVCHQRCAPTIIVKAAKLTEQESLQNNPSPSPISSSCARNLFLRTMSLGFLSVLNVDIVNAAGDENKGTKDDPKFQACLSKCVFECTKPKGEEQKSRSECLPECKTKCATTKEQLMMGRPLKSSA